ncbi:glutamyl-tRNA reductase [Leucobacter allii]|uniref:Glutamyl-tRNA reductase n=1 Tax=Leucobacter allii TaxID=2932247 RepID=A0ABY4FK23_9MICO|nr:glutamyl-tRNA reductase [Leucobacter allii]UOQ56519.1 glutamyl-tRNA reductase [Leucobacter allii]UOR00953.1 glutamyl-tRNA reductase [Leucobacter allii]
MLHSFSFSLDADAFALLERLSLHADAIAAALDDPAVAAGSAVLATCNRFEVYAETGAAGRDAVLDRIAAASGAPRSELERAVAVTADRDAAEHLFAVAAGLDSAVVGEEEIAGQVRRAHDDARTRGALTHDLERLFRTATRTSREVGRRTRIRSAGRSLVRLALRLAEARIPAWDRAEVLLIGTGAYAGATVTALRDRGAKRISVHSPSGRAMPFAAARGLDAVPEGGVAAAFASADLVIACTRVEDPVLTREQIARASAARADRARLLVDLGMPRNIDPEAQGLPGITLLDLETIARHAPVAELGAEAEAREIVRAAAEDFAATQAERDAVPALLALRGHVLGILEEELCRARSGSEVPRIPSGAADAGAVDAGSGAAVEAALRRFTGRLLHTPMTRIRSLGREGRAPDAAEALHALFGIEAD